MLLSDELIEILNIITSLETPNPSYESYQKLLKKKIESMSETQEKLELEEWRQFLLGANDPSQKFMSKEDRIKDIFFLISNFVQIDLAVAGKNLT